MPRDSVDTECLRTGQRGLEEQGVPGAIRVLVGIGDVKEHGITNEEVINARLWGGIHYRRSSEAGVHLGLKVAHYGLKHAFKPVH